MCADADDSSSSHTSARSFTSKLIKSPVASAKGRISRSPSVRSIQRRKSDPEGCCSPVSNDGSDRGVNRTLSGTEGFSPRSLRRKVRDSLKQQQQQQQQERGTSKTPLTAKKKKRDKITAECPQLPCTAEGEDKNTSTKGEDKYRATTENDTADESVCSSTTITKDKSKKSKKKKRGSSIGASADIVKKEKSSSKKEEKRSSSVGPRLVARSDKDRGRSKSLRRTKSKDTASKEENENRMKYASHWKSEGKLKDQDDDDDDNSSRRPKSRSTVDENGKIRRVSSRRKVTDDDDGSTTSKRSSSRTGSTSRGYDGWASPFSTKQHLQTNIVVPLTPVHSSKPDNVQMEVDALLDEILLLKKDRATGMEEAVKAKRELREVKLELQKCQTERGELKSEVREQDELRRKKECKIAVLEKAVESQLDKVDELEEELRRAHDEILSLESRISQLEDKEGIVSIDQDGRVLPQQQGRLERRLEQKEKDLESREQQLKADRKQILYGTSPSQEMEKLRREKEAANHLMKTKDEEIESLKRLLKGRESGNMSELRNNLDTAKVETDLMKSKLEGAQRRNQILEEDIDHWKSVNCNLEDELAEMKAQAAMWKAKYEAESAAFSSGGNGSVRGGLSAADISMMRKDDNGDDDNLNGSQSAIGNFWSKLTQSASNLSINASSHSVHSIQSREELINNVMF
jgi:hypothetical protein